MSFQLSKRDEVILRLNSELGKLKSQKQEKAAEVGFYVDIDCI